MADNNIIEAWEKVCATGDAPIGEHWGCSVTTKLADDTLKTLKYQKAEIERLKKEVEFAYKVTKTHTVKEFLERLKNSRSSKRYHHFVTKSDINRVAEEMVGEG